MMQVWVKFCHVDFHRPVVADALNANNMLASPALQAMLSAGTFKHYVGYPEAMPLRV
jgi:hypothetical protein